MKFCTVARSIFFTLAVSCLTACGIDGTGTTPPTQPPDIYAVGAETVGDLFKAVLWKNNVLTVLDSGQYGARAFAVAVANGNVYVAGFEGSPSGNDVAVLWTNGVPTTLTDGTGTGIAYGVAVSGNDVYAVGDEVTYNTSIGNYVQAAMCWKNGAPTVLNSGLPVSGNFILNAGATAIAADGSDIYIAGFVGANTETAPNTYTDEPVVTYWKNGVPTSVTSGLEYAQTSGIAVQNGHVYVSGQLCATFTPDCSVATIWTDGVASSLTPNLLSAASGVAVSGSNVYTSINVTDTTGNTAALSTDGNFTALSSTNLSAANCVATSGSDVYIGGAEIGDGETAGLGIAAYWKNGTVNYLSGTTNTSAVYAMAVVPSS
jgi:hypothetical protein